MHAHVKQEVENMLKDEYDVCMYVYMYVCMYVYVCMYEVYPILL